MNSVDSLAGICVVIPAAGMGVRMGAPVPKQYLEIAGKTILEHTISRLLALHPRRLVIAVSAGDERYKSIAVIDQCDIVTGGAERADSVLNGLKMLNLQSNDWIMVHDAVRPCVKSSDVISLCEKVADHDVGGLLGIPVTDTVKKTSGHQVVETLSRTDLWLAQTPQLFRYGILLRALENSENVTDEASAVEKLGYQPMMVQGHSDNIKVTTSDDLALAEHYLSRDLSRDLSQEERR
jgi:2-C-methyl-D-erythritol 4-phosphate cytidylyltransferase